MQVPTSQGVNKIKSWKHSDNIYGLFAMKLGFSLPVFLHVINSSRIMNVNLFLMCKSLTKIYLCVFFIGFLRLSNTSPVNAITDYHIEAKTNGRHCPDDIFKCVFLNENVLNSIKISLKFVPRGQINNILALV